MGLGKRFTYNISKLGETTPGPGMYANVEPESIKSRIDSYRSASNPRLGFGMSRDQREKVQYHGMQKHFLGRYGADVGKYEMPTKFGDT